MNCCQQQSNTASSYPATPLSSTMNSITWLSSCFSSPVVPSSNLLRFFSAGKEDLTDQIATRVKTLLGRVSFSCDEEHRRDLIAFQFYKLLELMLEQEEKRLQKTDFSTLLQLDSFHKSILAVCTVITMFAFKVESSYLSILEIFQIDPFEFSKVTDNVIRIDQKMPPEIQKHLQSIEEHIFECSAWKENSPVFLLLSRDGQQKFLELQLLQSPNRTPNKLSIHSRNLTSPKTPSSSSFSSSTFSLLQSPYTKAGNNNAAGAANTPEVATPSDATSSPSSSSVMMMTTTNTPATPSTPSTPNNSSGGWFGEIEIARIILSQSRKRCELSNQKSLPPNANSGRDDASFDVSYFTLYFDLASGDDLRQTYRSVDHLHDLRGVQGDEPG